MLEAETHEHREDGCRGEREQDAQERERERQEREQEKLEREQERREREEEAYDEGTQALDDGEWGRAASNFRRAADAKNRRSDGALRGCIGIPEPRHPLEDAVRRAAVSAALSDPRFAPVTAGELEGLAIQVSILTELRPGRADEVVLGRHGVVIRGRGRAALLLPQVAVEQGWDLETLLGQLCRKAGLPGDAWRDAKCELLLFETECESD